MILIFILAIYYLESVNKKLTKINFKYFYKKILILILLILSLKSFYLIYIIFLFLLFFEYRKILFKQHFYKILFNERVAYYFLFGIIIFTFTIFSNTGCLIYPASFTCLDFISWSIPKNEVVEMKTWYELWSKAGASPTYRVDNVDKYLSGLNWVPNWVQNHFFNKISDFLLSVITIVIVTSSFLLKFKNEKLSKKNYLLFYFFIIILLIEWFLNHPALRYGGFTLIALCIFIPLSLYIEKGINLNTELNKKITILVYISLIFFLLKNVDRIYKEYKRYNFNPLVNSHYNISENAYYFYELLLKAEKERNNDGKKFFIVLDRDLIKKIQTDK